MQVNITRNFLGHKANCRDLKDTIRIFLIFLWESHLDLGCQRTLRTRPTTTFTPADIYKPPVKGQSKLRDMGVLTLSLKSACKNSFVIFLRELL
ncbi:hypothetical protein A3F62_04810 [Candidatus Woesebacteria bacterium RIFCSPHIGHO2_12_FULL_44_11]|nr:MAG: hypothetical protein A3F62_04810 [Candidatus Woesebacteria bacterium RIFCSPHIGHO2_12_FULL_44_11]